MEIQVDDKLKKNAQTFMQNTLTTNFWLVKDFGWHCRKIRLDFLIHHKQKLFFRSQETGKTKFFICQIT